jgi:hypothetical protein
LQAIWVLLQAVAIPPSHLPATAVVVQFLHRVPIVLRPVADLPTLLRIFAVLNGTVKSRNCIVSWLIYMIRRRMKEKKIKWK